MYCPEHLVLKAFGGRVWIWMYWRDVPRERIPMRVWLNPLRYEFSMHVFRRVWKINPNGRAAHKFENWRYRVLKSNH